MKTLRLMLAAIALAGVAACAPARVQTVEGYAGPSLPRPDSVIVYEFAISPDQVRLGQGIGERITRAARGGPAGAGELQAARATQAALAEALTNELRSYGLMAEQAVGGGPPPTGTSLLVQGQIVGLDEGNRARRVVIGLGAGKSSVTADAQLYYVSGPTAPQLISQFKGSSNSGRAPGVAGTMGVGAVAGRAATSAAVGGVMHGGSEMRRTGDEVNATRLANALGKQIGRVAVAQGWIAPSAIK